MVVKAKKHCIVVTSFDENQPGFLDFSYRIASLAKEYQLTIVSLHDITQAELIFEQTDYQVFATRGGKLGWMVYLVKCAWFIRQQKPDIVILLHSAAAPITLLIGSIPTCLYWNEHPSHLVYSPKKFAPIRHALSKGIFHLLFLSAKSASLVMPIGEDHRDDLVKHQVIPSKIKLIYMGVSDSFLLEYKKTDSKNFISGNKKLQLIYIGSVSFERGRDVMLEAMSQLAYKGVNAHLSIIGAVGEQLKFCQQRVHELGIKKYVTLLGRIPGNKIPHYLAQADIGICLWEKSPWVEFNPPTKLFEYLVAGLPVLASNIRTHTRYVTYWHNGIIFDYDSTSLTNAISEIVTNKHLIPALKQKAKQSGEQYLWSKIEPTFLDAVRNVASNEVADNKSCKSKVVSF